MFTILSIIVCLQSNPHQCQQLIAPVEMTFGECIGAGGQFAAKEFLEDFNRRNDAKLVLVKVRCTQTNKPEKARGLLEDQPA